MNFNDFATRKSRRERKVIVAGRWFDGLRSPNGVVISPDMLPQFFVSIASGTTAFSLRFHLAPSKTGGARGRRCAPVRLLDVWPCHRALGELLLERKFPDSRSDRKGTSMHAGRDTSVHERARISERASATTLPDRITSRIAVFSMCLYLTTPSLNLVSFILDFIKKSTRADR